MNARALLLLFLLATSLAASAPAAAQGHACSTTDAALDTWRTREASVADAPEAVRVLYNDWLQRFQSASIERPDLACDYLDALLRASSAELAPQDAAAAVDHAADLAEALSAEELVVRPSLFAVGRAAGARVEAAANATPATPDRIAVLGGAVSVYERVGLQAERLRVSLWRAAETTAWTTDNERMERNLDAATTLRARLERPGTGALYVAQIPAAVRRLDADARIMATHAPDARGDPAVARIESSIEALRTVRPAAILDSLVVAGTVMGGTLITILLLRIPWQRMRADMRDLEVSLLAVPR